MEYYQRIKEARLKNSMTQRELADAAEIAPGSLSAYENGQKTPPVDVANRIAKVLSVSLDWLFNSEMTEDEMRISMRSYGDLARLLASLTMIQPENIKMQAGRWTYAPQPYTQEKVEEASQERTKIIENMKRHDIVAEIFSKFLDDFNQLNKLYIEKKIKKEVMDAWLRVKYAELEKMPLRSK